MEALCVVNRGKSRSRNQAGKGRGKNVPTVQN
jgi:hypothetical protein